MSQDEGIALEEMYGQGVGSYMYFFNYNRKGYWYVLEIDLIYNLFLNFN